MKSYFTCLSLVLLFLLWCGCTPSEQEAPVAEAPTTEADLEAIGKVGEEFVAAVLADDPVAFAACYTGDAVLMPPESEAVEGREAIQQWYEGLIAMGGETAAFEPSIDEVVLAGDWAFRRGVVRIVQRSEQGDETEEVAKFIEVWQRQADDSWKIARDIWNSNLP